MTTEKLLTPSAVARRLQVRPETVWRWIKKGVLPFEEVGPYKKKRVRESVADSMLQRGTTA